MNITPVGYNNVGYNNRNQSFGMAVEIDGKAIRRLSEELNNFTDTDRATKYFAETVGEPLKKLKTLVRVEDDRVFVEPVGTNKVYEILDGGIDPVTKKVLHPWAPDRNTLSFQVKDMDAPTKTTRLSVRYPKGTESANVSNYSYMNKPSLEAKMAYAKQIAEQTEKFVWLITERIYK